MLGKTPRFRGNGCNTPEAGARTQSPLRDPLKPKSRENVEDSQAETHSVKRATTSESVQSQMVKRSGASSSPEKNRLSQRELKRSTSYIPRAMISKARATAPGEARKPVMKSETSLKNETPDPSLKSDGMLSGRDKKSVGIKRNSEIETNPKSADASVRLQNSKKPITPTSLDANTSRFGKKTISKTSHTKMGSHSSPSTERNDIKIQKLQSESNTQSSAPTKSLEAQYLAKNTVYELSLKDFQEKKIAIRNQYLALEELRNKITSLGGRELGPEKTIMIGDLEPPFVLASQRKYDSERSVVIFETKLLDTINLDFTNFQNVFQNIFNQYEGIWSHLILLLANYRTELTNRIIDHYPHVDQNLLQEEQNSIDLAIENAKYHSKLKGEDLMAEVKKLYVNREALKQEITVLLDSDKLNPQLMKEQRDIAAKLEELNEELEKEKIRREDLMEKRVMLEKANASHVENIQNLETIVEEQKEQINQLTYKLKSMKQKEIMLNKGSYGIKGKELKELKVKSEMLKMTETRIIELSNDFNTQSKQLEGQIEELQKSLCLKQEMLESEKQEKERLTAHLAEAENTLNSIREKRKIFSEMIDTTKRIVQNSIAGSSKREEQLWTELEATKIIAKGYQDKLAKMQEEHSKIFLRFQTMAEDKSNQLPDRLAAECLRKDEIIKNLKDQVASLQSACEEHTSKYNALLAQVKDVHEKLDGKSDAMALSKQLGDVRMQKQELKDMVKELIMHNDELETALVQRSLELDQRDRLVKQQCNLLKMRDELNELIRTKDDSQGMKNMLEQSSKWEKKAEEIYNDLEKKANELDDMYKVLVEKQKQVDRLTKLVSVMEDQQDRAQEQRVRFELRISELQKQLAESKQNQTKASLLGH